MFCFRSQAFLVFFLGAISFSCSGESSPNRGSSEKVGTPTFALKTIDPNSPNNPWGKNVADLNNDGLPDIIIIGEAGPAVWYAAPRWNKAIIVNTGFHTESGSATGDIDGDGDIDITVGTHWFENPLPGGNPSDAWTVHSIGGAPGNHDIVVADLDGDGKQDVTMRGTNVSTVQISRQIDRPTWTSLDTDPGIGRNGLAIADLDGDGKQDIIVGGVWMKNPGTVAGSWTSHAFATWDNFAAVEAVDVNGDGRLDLVMSVSESNGPIAWFENPPIPTEPKWTQHTIDPGPLGKVHSLGIADMNHDGQVDVVATEFTEGGRVLIYYNGGNGLSWNRQVVASGRFLHNARVADMNADGNYDIMGGPVFGVGPVEVWENQGSTPGSSPKILVFWKAVDFFHDSIPQGIQAIRELGAQNGFTVDDSNDASLFNTVDNITQYHAVVFCLTQGDIFTSQQEATLQTYIRSGKSYVGIHSAADTEVNWSWYTGLVGSAFGGSHSNNTEATLLVESVNKPGTQGIPSPWVRFDEWYNYSPNPRTNGVTVLLRLDESSYVGGNMGSDHPIAWYHNYDGGRAWYTGGGHVASSFTDPAFRKHLLQGIQYALGILVP